MSPPPEKSFLAPGPDDLAARRAVIDAKQAQLAGILSELQCEGAVLLMPQHVAWFVGGWHVRGLLAETERPGVFTNGRQRWLVCSNVDTQRLFDEELDRLGFQLKEWPWAGGRAALLGELVAGKKVAADRPFPGVPTVNDRLRTETRALHPYEQARLRELGRVVAHALEATARMLHETDTEQEVAGQIAHRLYRHGAEPCAVSVEAFGAETPYPRPGYGPRPVGAGARLQATATRLGLFATASRTVHFGPRESSADFDLAVKLSAVYRAHARPGGTFAEAAAAGRPLTAGTPREFDWRDSQPGYGTGWLAAEELRRGGQDERFVPGQALVLQARVGAEVVVDTVVVTEAGPAAVTAPEGWPFRGVTIGGRRAEVPDALSRSSQ